MKKVNRVALPLCCALVLAASSAAYGRRLHRNVSAGSKDAAVAEEILRLEREYDQAFARNDAAALERLHTNDFRMTARGRVVTKPELLARLRDAAQPRDVIESLSTGDVRARVYGDVVVTTGSWKRVSHDATGKDTSAAGFFTRVWIRQGGAWRMAVAHYSPVATPARTQ